MLVDKNISHSPLRYKICKWTSQLMSLCPSIKRHNKISWHIDCFKFYMEVPYSLYNIRNKQNYWCYCKIKTLWTFLYAADALQIFDFPLLSRSKHHIYIFIKSLFYRGVLYNLCTSHHINLLLSLSLLPQVASQSASFILKQYRF